MNAEDQPSVDVVQTEKPAVNGNSGLIMVADLGEVIDLKGDELPTESSKGRIADGVIAENAKLWHYVDHHGTVQGLFSFHMMKRWRNANYLHPGFKVWRVRSQQEC
ncbi:unnamed protein product [Fraxinus pennsylvanica]|uniref:GYF domain-containing protein n=1 Tax=Fraxinus pennsylvanica TaxID=56036 RepID=A0AAD1ZHB2_9LAMI|nr:unnamed protein product [Fraxinus pennsylvanica]